ncbi:RNA 2',3'-cyclic phosphodiesterase [Embleya sp. NBC_00896]|uniref:RNA 2',3'-cyclic phosphodiesterase n=1 Tax=Embleya sp. NBC_00896 TaxID=2975961 RepID=UPI002F91B74D|nr:RNA 2',3'-cyclic phosphodiesterase [Embleya sp. NBC_00896]
MTDDDPTPPTTVRLFVALAPPDDAKDELHRALRPVYAAHPLLRWNRIEDWHITLAFLGEVPADVVPELRTRLADVAASGRPIALELRGTGRFDERVLWSGVHGELEDLHALAEATRGAVLECGIALEDRPLRPHLTLARARRGNPDGIGAAARELAGFTGRRWQAERLHLVGSNVGRGPGPIRYRDVAAWPLGAG